MKRNLVFIFMVVIMLCMPCWADDQKISFEHNKSLEPRIRQIINKPAGDIYQSDLSGISELTVAGRDLYIVQYMSNLKSLEVHSGRNEYANNFVDYGYINTLKGLEKLKIVQEYPASFYFSWLISIQTTQLEALPNLKELYIDDHEPRYLANIWKFTNLEKLTLISLNLKDISGITQMTQLKSLDLRNNQIEDISALADLPNLETLYLGDNPIKDYTPVQNIYKNLQGKDFVMVRNTHGKWVGKMTARKEVIFVNKMIEEQVRKTLKKPTGPIVDADILKITDLTIPAGVEMGGIPLDDLKYFPNLKSLNLETPDKTILEDCAPLQNLKNLKSFSYRGFVIAYDMASSFDVKTLSSLKNLEILDIRECSIANLSALSSLKQLKKVSLSCEDSPEPYDITAIQSLPKLTHLSLSAMKINKLGSQKWPDTLKSLEMISVGIDNAGKFGSRIKLEALNLSGNPIKDIGFLKYLPQLKKLDLSNTKVKNLKPIGYLKNLNALFLKGTPAENFSPLKSIYPHLKEKDFTLTKSN